MDVEVGGSCARTAHSLESADARRSELRALPLLALFLVWAFGAIVAAFSPIMVGVLAIVLSLGAASLVTFVWPLNPLLQNLISLLGLALGVDYALLMVSRFREYLAAGLDSSQAASHALSRAGRAICISGCVVAVGFLALLTVPAQEMKSLAIGGLLVVLFAVLLATTLLPVVLAWLGRYIDAGRIRRKPVGTKANRKWGRWVLAISARGSVCSGR